MLGGAEGGETAQPCPQDSTVQLGLQCYLRQINMAPMLTSHIVWNQNNHFMCLPPLAHQIPQEQKPGLVHSCFPDIQHWA